MAITIIKEPSGITPSYNDSFIKFTTDLTGQTETLITFLPTALFAKPFKIPNINGTNTINLKVFVKNQINEKGLKDNYPIPSNWIQTLEDGLINQTVMLQDFGPNQTGSTISKTYEFDKSVKQVDEKLFINNAQILNYSENGIDYNLTYFEGYPFTFELQKISKGNEITVKNINNNITSQALSAETTNTQRIYIDKGITNWTTSKFLPLIDELNRLEIFENDLFKSKLFLKKETPKCGYYLKWLNRAGGYSYWLFDEFGTTQLKTKALKNISTNPFKNVGGLVATTMPTGFESEKSITVKSRFDVNEGKILESLYDSQSVQLYSAKEPFRVGSWLDVTVKGTLNSSNKKAINDITVTIELPQIITQKI